jgi:hypothetical protein
MLSKSVYEALGKLFLDCAFEVHKELALVYWNRFMKNVFAKNLEIKM